jgi:hypothetical protein
MQVRRRRVEPCLDTQRLATLQFRDQFGLDQQFIRAALSMGTNHTRSAPNYKFLPGARPRIRY